MTGRQRLIRLWRRCSGPRGRDIGIVCLALVFAVALVGSTWAENGMGAAVPALLVSLPGVVLLWWRRRWPLTVTAIGGVITLAAGMSATVAFGLFTLAIRRRDRVLVLATAYTGLCLAAPYPWSGSSTWSWGGLIGGALGALVFALWGSYVGARRDLLESLRERASRAEAERELRAAQARTAERARIAREMHDVLAHKVSLIALQAGALEVNAARSPAAVEQAAAEIRGTARETLEDLRGVLGVLRSEDGDESLLPQPGLADLPRLVERSRVGGATIDLHVDVDPAQVPQGLGRTVYRIVQEGLTNAHKHARGARIRVEVRAAGDLLEVRIANSTGSPDADRLPGSGAGLIGLAERVELAGGSLSAGPARGGWEILARLPVHPPDMAADDDPAPVPQARTGGLGTTVAERSAAAGDTPSGE